MSLTSKLKEFLALERNVLLVLAISFVWTGTYEMWRSFLPKFYESLGATLIIIGAIYSLSDLLGSFSGIFYGYFIDKLGRKIILVSSAYSLLIASLIFLLSTNWMHIVFPALILALATSGFSLSQRVLLTDSLPVRKRATGFSLLFLTVSIPSIFAAPIGGWLVQTFGMVNGVKISLAVTFLVCLCVFTSAFYFVKETLKRRRVKHIGKKIGKLKSILKLLKEIPRPLKALLIAGSIQSFGAGVALVYIVFFALDVIGATPFQYSLLFALEGLICFMIFLPAGKLSDKFGRRLFILIMSFLSFLAMVIVASAGTFWHLALATAVGAISTIGLPAMYAYIGDLTPLKNRGRVMGLQETFISISLTPGPIIGAILYSIFPRLTFIVASLLYFLDFLIILIFVKESFFRKKK